jgi:glutamine amidotransferase
MCRLFGYRSQEPTGVQHELLEAANALCVQSREHPDGWGLGWYVGGAPQVERALDPAHEDDDFSAVGRSVASTTIVAHVRKASVGRVSLENTHPFQWGPWLFVHNGTIPAWDKCGAAVEALVDPAFRRELSGETDSERCFLLFLSRLARRCDLAAATFDACAEALAETVELVRGAAEPIAKAEASTTFLATDGKLMIACRRGRTLFVETPAPHAGGRVSSVVIASEQPCRCATRSFREVPEGSLVGVDESMRVQMRPLSAAAAA